ncbi:MAG: cytochrome P450 [Alphaproteobacteria bacterium]|nr:MAG: cytochrome P450 [Alphaproteobacteria bacterium]
MLDGVVHAMIQERRAAGPRGGDLLDRLIDAAPASVREGAGRRWIRDQVMSILLAAHETTSLAVLWAMVELAAHPDIEAHLVRESRAADLDPGTGFGLLAQLRFADSVFREALRLYPPAWCYSRRAIAADRMGSHHIPAGATVVLCPYTIQRKAEYWDRPDRFDPWRFHDRDPAAIVPGSYFPFAGGNHICLGNRFAMIEGTLILAGLYRDFRFHILNPAPIRPLPATTLRPNIPVLAHVRLCHDTSRRAA